MLSIVWVGMAGRRMGIEIASVRRFCRLVDANFGGTWFEIERWVKFGNAGSRTEEAATLRKDGNAESGVEHMRSVRSVDAGASSVG